MPETQDEGYILDDSGLKPYSIEDAEDTKEHKQLATSRKIGGIFIPEFKKVR